MGRDFEDHCWKDIIPAEILETYKTYRRQTRVGARPALLAIDLYNFVYKGGPHPPHEIAHLYPNACGIYAWNAIEPTRRLLAAARAAGLPVIYSTTAEIARRLRATKRQTAATVDDDAWQIHDAFKPEKDDLIVPKERASVFFGTALVAHLMRLDINSLVVCGESTSGCVRATVVDAYSYGFHCSVVEECTFDRNPVSHKVNLFDLHHKYADVMMLDEVLDHLRASRTTVRAGASA